MGVWCYPARPCRPSLSHAYTSVRPFSKNLFHEDDISVYLLLSHQLKNIIFINLSIEIFIIARYASKYHSRSGRRGPLRSFGKREVRGKVEGSLMTSCGLDCSKIVEDL
jgi:hypothetical protein